MSEIGEVQGEASDIQIIGAGAENNRGNTFCDRSVPFLEKRKVRLFEAGYWFEILLFQEKKG